ncbi:siderophore-interacting protein [Neorhizobium sp. NCHU2750]|uniref:siderophore-interacting protein n=1 Tax=Neorhizobium sp. NCHU2750 TaxID=1825976 RepID=UPI000E75C984|nr:hypothetical protein NCHU2750_52070 [Neorhizobium sp. NCHU2750]
MSGPRYLLGEVISHHHVTPSMIRIVIGGDDVRSFSSSRKADEWVRLVFPHAETGQVTLPVFTGSGWATPEGQLSSESRPYSIRAWDTSNGTVTIDFVAHEGGVASTWAMNAVTGVKIGIGPAGGKYDPPEDRDWTLLLCDVTGLPAASRIIEECPKGCRILANIEIPGERDRQRIQTEADLCLCWQESFGTPEKSTCLVDMARAIELPEGNGYIWIAGEATAVSDCRKHFRDAAGIDKSRIVSVGYWIDGQAR